MSQITKRLKISSAYLSALLLALAPAGIFAQSDYEEAENEIEKVEIENRKASSAIAAIKQQLGLGVQPCATAYPEGPWESLRKSIETERRDIEKSYFRTQQLAREIDKHRLDHIEAYRQSVEEARSELSTISYNSKLDEYGSRIKFEYVAFYRTFVFPAYDKYVEAIRLYYTSLFQGMSACNNGESEPDLVLKNAPNRIREKQSEIRALVDSGIAELEMFDHSD